MCCNAKSFKNENPSSFAQTLLKFEKLNDLFSNNPKADAITHIRNSSFKLFRLFPLLRIKY